MLKSFHCIPYPNKITLWANHTQGLFDTRGKKDISLRYFTQVSSNIKKKRNSLQLSNCKSFRDELKNNGSQFLQRTTRVFSFLIS